MGAEHKIGAFHRYLADLYRVNNNIKWGIELIQDKGIIWYWLLKYINSEWKS